MKKKDKEPAFDGDYDDSGDDDSKSKHKLILNVSDTKYPVVKFVGKKIFKWALQYDNESVNWDMYWTDQAVPPEQLGKMQPHQKINHFPGMYTLARKNHLGRNLMKMRKQFPNDFKFFPQTWLLPAEYSDFKNQFQKGKTKTFIIKPEASCQGRGIFLTRNINDINPTDHYVAQRYLHKPFLIDGLKFDLRVYVMLAGTDPMRIYVFKDGLVRFATEPYSMPNNSNMEDVCMHLTNYAINKDNPNFIFNQDAGKMDVGHKRSITSVFERLEQEGHNIKKLWEEMSDLFIKTFCAVQPVLSHHYKSCQPDNYANNMCFEILGFDIFLNDRLKPQLLEVNHTPSFTTDTPLDSLIKKNLIRDALKLMNINSKTKEAIQSQRKEILQQRVLTGKKTKLSQEEKAEIQQKYQLERDTYENSHLGGYFKIYPLENAAKYDQIIQYAAEVQDSWTGANIRRNIKKNIEQIPQSLPNKPRKPNTPTGTTLPKIQQQTNSVVGEDETIRHPSLKLTLSEGKKQTRQLSEPPKIKVRQKSFKAQQQVVQVGKPCVQPKLFELDVLEMDKQKQYSKKPPLHNIFGYLNK